MSLESVVPPPICRSPIVNFTKFYAEAKRSKARHSVSLDRIVQASVPQKEPVIRVSFVASKKGVDKRAVRRNRAKRRLRALVSTLLKRDWMSLPKDVELEWLILAHRSSLVCSWKELETEVFGHWERIKASLPRQSATKEGLDERI